MCKRSFLKIETNLPGEEHLLFEHIIGGPCSDPLANFYEQGLRYDPRISDVSV